MPILSKPRAVALGALTVLAGALAAVAAGAGTASAAGSATVAKDGSGNFRTVQAAVNAGTFTITVKPGTYHELVTIPSNKPYITLVGSTGRASDVVIEYNNASGTAKPGGGTYGTAGSASVTVSAHDFTARNLTLANT